MTNAPVYRKTEMYAMHKIIIGKGSVPPVDVKEKVHSRYTQFLNGGLAV